MPVATLRQLLEGRSPLRSPDPPLESEDAPLHLHRAQRHPHHRPAADPVDRWTTPTTSRATSSPAASRSCSSAPRSRRRTRSEEGCARSGHVLRQPPLDGRHADQLHRHPAPPAHLAELRAAHARGDFDRMGAKEANVNQDEIERLERHFGGMKEMKRLPGALFIVDCRKEQLAVTEANKLHIPVDRDRGQQRRPRADPAHHPRQRRRDPGGPIDHRPESSTPSSSGTAALGEHGAARAPGLPDEAAAEAAAEAARRQRPRPRTPRARESGRDGGRCTAGRGGIVGRDRAPARSSSCAR